MKRDPRLHLLSHDHHHALAFVVRATRRLAESPAAAETLWHEARARFAGEFEAHFAVEEEALLPALRAAGELELVERTLAEHRTLRAMVAADTTDADSLGAFLEGLRGHVRFEERVLFPRAQACLDSTALDAVEAKRRALDHNGGSDDRSLDSP